MRGERHHPVTTCSFITEMTVCSSITFDDIETIYQLTHIIRIIIFICEKEFLKFGVFFSFEMRGIEAHSLTIFQ